MPRIPVTSQNACRLPVSVGMELLRNVTALYQNAFIGRGEKDFMTERIQDGLRTGDYSQLYQYILIKVPTAQSDNPFFGVMKNLIEKEE